MDTCMHCGTCVECGAHNQETIDALRARVAELEAQWVTINKALAHATDAFVEGDLMRVATANETLQPMIDAAVVWGKGRSVPLAERIAELTVEAQGLQARAEQAERGRSVWEKRALEQEQMKEQAERERDALQRRCDRLVSGDEIESDRLTARDDQLLAAIAALDALQRR